jgi:methionyl-tRNA formyltransferase
MNVIFLAYRDWAKKAVRQIQTQSQVTSHVCFDQPETFRKFFSEECHSKQTWIVIAIGWSWIIDDDVLEKCLCVGVHPSDLPHYRGGSPVQNQIIDGVTHTKLTLFQIAKKLDSGDIWGNVDLLLDGDTTDQIFEKIEIATVQALKDFFEHYPHITPIRQDITQGSYAKRRTPSDSQLHAIDFSPENLLRTYNKIRCLTDPYPNAYVEDDQGNRLVFKLVSYIKNNYKAEK